MFKSVYAFIHYYKRIISIHKTVGLHRLLPIMVDNDLLKSLFEFFFLITRLNIDFDIRSEGR